MGEARRSLQEEAGEGAAGLGAGVAKAEGVAAGEQEGEHQDVGQGRAAGAPAHLADDAVLHPFGEEVAFTQFEVAPLGGGGLHHTGRIGEDGLGLKPDHHGFGGGFVGLEAATIGHHLEELAELVGGGLKGGASWGGAGSWGTGGSLLQK
jgi:hypothetical protein